MKKINEFHIQMEKLFRDNKKQKLCTILAGLLTFDQFQLDEARF